MTSWANALEKGGFRRAIAGDRDFFAAVNAMERITENNMGLIVAGEYGTGKTCFLKAIMPYFREKPKYINLSDPDDVDRLSDRSMEFWGDNLYERNIILDDLGAEKPINDYGVLYEPAAEFIIRYYDIGKKRMIIATNLNTPQLDDRHGGRLLSRLREKCYPLHFTGKDKRQWQI